MKAQEWAFLDKSAWRAGPWRDEPDKAQWVDEATGLPCLAVRHDTSGHWCGYVGVTETHPFFGLGYDDCKKNEDEWVSVHGGLTFASFCTESDKEHGICHVVEPGEDDRVWWLGFDCAHCDDFSPVSDQRARFYGLQRQGGVYRTLAFVKREAAYLARQIAEAGGVK